MTKTADKYSLGLWLLVALLLAVFTMQYVQSGLGMQPIVQAADPCSATQSQ